MNNNFVIKTLIVSLLSINLIACSHVKKREILFDANKLIINNEYVLNGYISYRNESLSLYPNIYFVNENKNCVNLTNIEDFFEEKDNWRYVKLKIRMIENPYKGKITLLTCTEKSAMIVNVIHRGSVDVIFE